MQEKHPTPIPAEFPLSSHVRRPKLYLRLDDLFPPLPIPARRRVAVAAGATVAAAAVSLLLLWSWHENATDIPVGDGGGSPAVVTVPSETERDPITTESECTRGEPADTSEPTESMLPDETESPTESLEVTEMTAEENGPASGTEDGSIDETPPMQDSETTAEPVTTAPDSETTAEPVTTTPDSETIPEESAPPIPDGCLSFVYWDKSESNLGAGYIQNDGLTLPETLPTDSPWKIGTPTVLIINTRPYEGYGGGESWYDPTAGSLALTNTPNAPDGVVALGTALARALRERGITVIHLRVPVSEEDSTAAITKRTEEAIRYYSRLYPDISLVLDLRRSAELTADGNILATRGTYNGNLCAQLRITVSGGRSEETLGYDLAVATALRKSLWNTEPTLSRPVRVKSGTGIAGDLTDLRILTLEMGSAGNTYGEASMLVNPLCNAIAQTMQK